MANNRTHPTIPTLFRVVALIAWGMAPMAAVAGEAESSPMRIRREVLASRGSEVRVEGQLSCRIQQDAKGDHCNLRIEDFHSGKFFRLMDEAAALQMYMKGTRTVAVTGKITDFQTLSVESVESL